MIYLVVQYVYIISAVLYFLMATIVTNRLDCYVQQLWPTPRRNRCSVAAVWPACAVAGLLWLPLLPLLGWFLYQTGGLGTTNSIMPLLPQ